jgi:hypothetical protein
LRELIYEIENWIESEHPEYIDTLMSISEYDKKLDDYRYERAYFSYFEYLQKNIDRPLTLGISKLDRLLDYPDLAKGFFALLRSMNEKTKSNQKWYKFRLILSHSTPLIQHFIPLDLNASPFNVGDLIELPQFTQEQVLELYQLSNLPSIEPQISELMHWLGGIPSLIHLTIQKSRTDGIHPIERIIAGDRDKIFSIYQEHLNNLKKDVEKHNLQSIMQEIVNNHQPTPGISLREQCLLHRRGLVVFAGDDRIFPRCELYRAYFATRSPSR